LNNNIYINSSTIINSKCFNDGGGLYIGYNNIGIFIYRCLIYDNIAIKNGGGMYLYRDNSMIYIIGSNFISNIAYKSGGAIYFNDNCRDILIIDVDGYDQQQSSDNINIQHSSSTYSNTIVYVDVKLEKEIFFFISTDDNQLYKQISILFSPGISTSILIIPTLEQYQLTLLQPRDDSSGKIHTIPIIMNPKIKCIFKNNIAFFNGGAIYFHTIN